MGNDNIPPLELQTEIMKRLPIKKLIQSRSVSKSWKSIIDGAKFISDYNSSHTHQQHQQLLVSLYQQTEVYIINDDNNNTFTQNKVSLSLPLSCQPSFYNRNNMIGYSQGLFAFYNYDAASYPSTHAKKRIAVIWNPSIRKSVDVPVPNVLQWPYDTVFGFGVFNNNKNNNASTTHDPIIVKINYIATIDFESSSGDVIPWQVEVFTLSSGIWRSLCSDHRNNPRKSLKFTRKSVIMDRFIYWIATDRSTPVVVGNTFHQNNTSIVLSFDITSEVFAEIRLPTCLACISHDDLQLFKVSESLVVLEMGVEEGRQEYGVWILDSVSDCSFRKLFVIKAPEASILSRVLGFRKNGQPVIEIRHDSDKQTPLSVYEPESERFIDTGIYTNGYAYFAGSYVPTFLLFDY